MIATEDAYIFEWDGQPDLAKRNIPLQDGSIMRPGNCFTGFRSRKTSAGFPNFDLATGYLKYLGTFDGLDGTLVLFDWLGTDTEIPDNIFYGWKLLFDGYLFFSTPGCSGRVVGTEIVERV